ncbi:hypothetical protein BDP27DRAFT_21312 [Rhodocollybia butyracea]|uniref:Transaldolase n=1 Tax=Rhodocollybia butyracea TaxID=206335 RepID=A0A9P5UGM1_9AGAR|nr:hypothetical protein BDP27DRAFT_21312 [Rhodocollybia butyracea]
MVIIRGHHSSFILLLAMPSPSSSRPMRSLPSVPPSERSKRRQQSLVRAVPEWRGTLQETIKSTTRIVLETLNHDALSQRNSDGTGLTPEVVLNAISDDWDGRYHLYAANQKVLEIYNSTNALKDVLRNGPKLLSYGKLVFNHLLVELGISLLENFSGPHFTFVDPSQALAPEDGHRTDISGRKSPWDSDNPSDRIARAVGDIIETARELHGMFIAAGAQWHRVIIGIPATQTGVLAAARLEGEYNIYTNLYLVSGLIHAIASAEARPSCITLDVAAILEWYERRNANFASNLLIHPGVIEIQSILRYYKLYMIPTTVMGRNFRNAHEISVLAVPAFHFVSPGFHL